MANTTMNKFGSKLPPVKTGQRFGEEIRQLKFFNFKYFDFKGKKYFIARSGWSKQNGFEVYVEDNSAGQDLFDYLFEHGKEFNVRAGCPNLIERIESALLSYGSDFDNRDNPFEANFDKFVNLDSEVNFLGKERLKKIKQEGINRKLMGVKINHNKIYDYLAKGYKSLYKNNSTFYDGILLLEQGHNLLLDLSLF